MKAEEIHPDFIKEVLNDPDYEGTILRHIFEILNKESVSDHIYDHDLYNLICSMRLKNCEILFRSYDFNLKKIEQILGILKGYKHNIATLASSLNFIGDVPNDFVTKLIDDAIRIFEMIEQLYKGASDNNNWFLLEEIFVILKEEYLENKNNLEYLNIVLNEYLPFRVFVDENSDFSNNYDMSIIFLVNKLFLKPELENNGEPYHSVKNYFDIEKKIPIRKKSDIDPEIDPEIDNYFKFDLKEIIKIFLKDLPIEFVYLNKILNQPEPTASGVTINGNMNFFFNPSGVPLEDEVGDLFPEYTPKFKSINDILGEGKMYEIFKIILSIKIRSSENLSGIFYTTLNGDRLCRHNYYNIINKKIIELKETVKGTATPPSSPNPETDPLLRPTSFHKIIIGAATKVSSAITSVKRKTKSKIDSVKNKFYELLTKLIIKYLEKKGITGLDSFITSVGNLTVDKLNFKTIDELISILLKNENLNNLTVAIRKAQTIAGNLCIDYVSYLHYILPIQKNLFKLSLGTDFFSHKFNQMLQECPDNVQQYFKYNKMKIDLMEYIIKKQNLSNLYDGIELALIYLIIKFISKKPDNMTLSEYLFKKYIPPLSPVLPGEAPDDIDSIEWNIEKHRNQEAIEKIMGIFESDGFTNKYVDVKVAMFESLTSITEYSTIEFPAFSSTGVVATEDGAEITNRTKGYEIKQVSGGLVNFFIKNPYWLGSAALATTAAAAFSAETVIDLCIKFGGPALEKATRHLSSYFSSYFYKGGGKRTRKYRKNQTRKAKRNRHGKNKSHKRKNKNKRKNKKTKRS